MWGIPYIQLISGSYFLALFAILFCYKKPEPTQLRFFTWFILFEYAVQLTTVFRYFLWHGSNHYILNILSFVTYVFYLYIFYVVFQKKIIKNIMLAFIAAFVITFFAEALLLKNFFSFLTIADTTGRVYVFISCLAYILSLLTRDEIINYFRIPMFWIATGILISIIGDWIYFLFFHLILQQNLDPGGQINYALIIITNNIQYLLFAIGFCSNRQWKKVS